MHTGDNRFHLDRSRNATAQVFEHLRELIVSLAIQPGTVLARPQLCEYYKLSASPVREALLRLEEEHLVDIYPQHQTRVRRIDLAQARQAHFLRLSVELEMAQVLATSRDVLLARTLASLVERQRASLAAGDLAMFTQIDMEFHRCLYHAAAVPDLWSMMRSRSGNLDRLRRLHLPLNGKAQSILAEHAAIADAIGRGDAAAAQQMVRVHLSGTLSAIDALRTRYPDLLLPLDYQAPVMAA